jgi:septum formation protein
MMADQSPDFLYLASASPRRSELLTQLGLRFEVLPVDVDESRTRGEAGADYVCRLAMCKARDARATLGFAAAPVLAADTAVVVDDDIFGKPSNQDDAVRMLTALSGRVHEVFTAVAALDGSKEGYRLSRTRVRFRPVSKAQMTNYWQTGEPAGKAGAYAIQGLGAVLIEEIHGSYTGVMGLPLFETAHLLTDFGFRFL